MAAGMVLVVDDDPVIRNFHSTLLEQVGFSVMTAENGEQGLSVMSTVQPRLILLDIDMPVMNGIEMCRRLRNRMANSVPVLFVTANDRLQVLHDCIEAGGDDFLIKGAPYKTMLERIAYWIRASRRSVQSEQRLTLLNKLKAALSAAPKSTDASSPQRSVRPVRTEDLAGKGVSDYRRSEEVKRVETMLKLAVAEVPEALRHKSDRKLAYFGYAVGVLNGQAKTSVVIKFRFKEFLRAALYEDKVITHAQADSMIGNLPEFYDNPLFHRACEVGESDFEASAKRAVGAFGLVDLMGMHNVPQAKC